MTQARTKIFIVDDHAGMRDAIATFVADQFEVIGMAATAEEALTNERIAKAEVALIDVSLPRISGIDLVPELLKRWPDLRCLMLSGHDSLSYVDRSLTAGARGYIRKEDPTEIVEGIRRVSAGDVFICSHFRHHFSDGRPRFPQPPRTAASA